MKRVREYKRLAQSVSRAFNVPVERCENVLKQYRQRTQTWERDWEGELARTRVIIRIAIKERHKKLGANA